MEEQEALLFVAGVVVVGELLILSFVFDFFLLLNPFISFLLLCVKDVKRINGERKETKMFLYSNFILKFTTILLM